ncbi:MAG: cob(I)yrinic acid a,c-diamide adenosyltransferase [Acidaminococcales bacterium]|jgi:cob(I)alamin adenosyltransferase|nr:cob(I)yrinic acid a,c-diamide adenosyltransferase [Acidaminococcales bacterium]
MLEGKQGMIQVYTGDGKGKTTASLGLALRAVGHGFKVLMIQFLKGDPEYGEVKAAGFLPGLEIRQVGRDCFVNFAAPDPVDVKMAAEGWEMAKAAVLSRKYNMVILDEINIAMGTKLLPTAAVAGFLREISPPPAEIVLTGRMAPAEVIELADLVTEMKEVRHYFDKGVHSRNGIDH